MKEKRFKGFKCYSYPLKQFLEKSGEMVLCKGKDDLSDDTFWLFLQSDRLSELLNLWGQNKPKKHSYN